MAKRATIKNEEEQEVKIGSYFTQNKKKIQFVRSGCATLDCVLGGGYALGRVVNIVGDKAVGKTLLCIEACANFLRQYPEGTIWYNETESAFDEDYAQALGLPVEKINFTYDCDTVEGFFEHLSKCIDEHDGTHPGIYVLDSLDSISDEAELKRGINDGSYGTAKPKKLSELFRRLRSKLKKKNICLIIISQIRDNLNAGMFAKQHKRSGGKALDFYASQVIWLAQIKTLEKTKRKIKRPIGVMVKAKCEKNKVGMPYRSCTFLLRFGFGVDDLRSSLEWLLEVGQQQLLDMSQAEAKKTIDAFDDMSQKEYSKISRKAAKVVRKYWFEVEEEFIPNKRKY